MPTVFEIVKDPEFYELPEQEQIKVLSTIDSDFASLGDNAKIEALDGLSGKYRQKIQLNVQDAIIPDEMAMAHAKTKFGATANQLSHADQSVLDAMQRIKSSTAPSIGAAVRPVVRPVLEGAGTAAGGLIGAGLGPAGAAAGGAGGYAITKGALDVADEIMGNKPVPSLKDRLLETGKDLKTGAMYEMAGQALMPIFRGGKLLFQKTKGGVEALTKKSGFEKEAGKILRANKSSGTIYDKNADHAAKIEKEIPELKFTLGQKTGDPNLIKLERAQTRGAKAASEWAERTARNNEALRDYYQKNFPDEADIDDVFAALSSQRDINKGNVVTAENRAEKALSSISAEDPTNIGQRIYESLETGKIAAKKASKELYNAVPEETQIDISDMLKSFESISQPMSKFEEPGNVPGILGRVKELVGDSNTASLGDLQGLRSELIAQSRQARSSATPNERLASRLSRAADAVTDSITKAEQGSQELLAANKFFRENYAEPFKQGTVGDILRKGAKGEKTRIPISKIPSKIWNDRTLGGSNDIIRAIGKDKSKEIMRDHAAYDLMNTVTDADGNIVPSKLKNWRKKNEPLLKRFDIKQEFDKLSNIQEAVDTAKKTANDFEKSIAARFLDSDTETAIANTIKGGNTGKAAAELMEQVKSDKTAVKGLQKAFADHIINSIEDISNKPIISKETAAEAFSRIIKKYTPAMNVLYKDAPEKLNALKKMQRAYEISVRNIGSPIGGGSDTAENIFTYLSKVNRKASVAKGIFRFIRGYSDKQINGLVTRAMFDPEYAKTLIKASMEGVDAAKMQVEMNGKIIQLDYYLKNRSGQAAVATLSASQSQYHGKESSLPTPPAGFVVDYHENGSSLPTPPAGFVVDYHENGSSLPTPPAGFVID